MDTDVSRRCADAVRMARSPVRLQRAPPSHLLSEAAILVARAIVIAADQRSRNRQLRAETMTMLDAAGLAIATEMRRRTSERTA